jgi:hypothetical protein
MSKGNDWVICGFCCYHWFFAMATFMDELNGTDHVSMFVLHGKGEHGVGDAS